MVELFCAVAAVSALVGHPAGSTQRAAGHPGFPGRETGAPGRDRPGDAASVAGTPSRNPRGRR